MLVFLSYEKNDFSEIPKNLAEYRSHKNIILLDQNIYEKT